MTVSLMVYAAVISSSVTCVRGTAVLWAALAAVTASTLSTTGAVLSGLPGAASFSIIELHVEDFGCYSE